MWWGRQCPLYCKFAAESDDERIFKVGQYLMKLSYNKSESFSFFLAHSCYRNYGEGDLLSVVF